MTAYNDSFKLTVKDVELIEEALRNEIGALTRRVHLSPDATSTGDPGREDRIKRLHQVLGKIHSQKMWYGQAHHTGTPLSG